MKFVRLHAVRFPSMRTYSFQNGVFRCDVDYRSQVGFLEYDFNMGIFHADKPSGIPSFVWLNQVVKFANIARKFVEPLNNGD